MLRALLATVMIQIACPFQDNGPPPAEAPTAPTPTTPAPAETTTTQHTLARANGPLLYTATAGYLTLPDYAGKPKARIFYVAYIRDAVPGTPPAGTARRPITFAFNGGPGSSSVWLHMGALGPRRVQMGNEADPPTVPPPPAILVDNAETWLDFTDLVFIDPVSTGYSRPVEGEDARQFHGLDEDIRAVGEFIRLYTTRAKRWDSPKFLAGESYGTTRAAGLASYLQDAHGLYINGLVLVSAVLHFQTIDFDPGNDTPYWLFLPTYTATAWYHSRLEPALQADLRRTLAEVEEWARTEYLLALARGGALPPDARRRTAERLARYTGLSTEFILQADLRPRIFHVTKELLRDTGRTVGRLDSRFLGIDASGVGAAPDYDPSYAAILGPYSGAVNHYLRTDLAYENDNPYEILTGRVQPWSYAGQQNSYVNTGESLRAAMSRNQHLRVFIASGYYDLATPYFATEYTIDHLGLDPSLRANVTTRYYEAGHMMYIRSADRVKLRDDVAGWLQSVLPP